MKVSSLRAFLDGFRDDDEVAIGITVDEKENHIVTYDVSFGVCEGKDPMLETVVYSSEIKE